MKTRSESLFEDLCAAQGLGCTKIEEVANKTPDYSVRIGDLEFVAEVKEVNPNNEQKKLLAEFEKKGAIVVNSTPGKKVRSKIKSSAAQISKLAKGKMPGMLVLYNNLPFVLGDPFEPYNVRVGMFGFDTIVLTKPRDFSAPRVLDRKFGPKRKVTKEHNTSISALAVINKKVPNQLDVYHNPHAAIPFKRGLFQELGNKEYELEEKRPMRFQEWKEVGS
jgi:hypothetical protein